MLSNIYLKMLYRLSIFGLLASILIGFSEEIFHHIMEIFHMLFEMTESGLDKVVEHFLETDMRDTQIIVFYIMVLIIAIVSYASFVYLLRFYRNFITAWNVDWTSFKSEIVIDWQSLSVTYKIFWIGGFLLINFLAFFFLM